MRRAGAALAIALAAVAVAGCGASTEDLMAIEVTHGPAHRELRIRVTNDGRASCGGQLQPLASQTLLDAREVKRAMRPLARRGATFAAAGSGRHYLFRSFDGSVSWSEGSHGPPALGRTTLLALRLERQLCRG